MLNSAKRRISVLERSIPLPITADRIMASAQERVRLTGASLDDALQSLMVSLSAEDLNRLVEEFLQNAYGDDVEAKEEAKRQFAKNNEPPGLDGLGRGSIATDNCSYQADVSLPNQVPRTGPLRA
jgi:hypothetical protein